MTHPFEVGKTYRNRVGEYVVQAIDGDRMRIRYVGGGILDTNVHVQARIWENIQFEEQTVREEERLRLAKEARLAARKRTAQRKAEARRARAKPTFGGFREDDFRPKKRGIAWSSRKELGKLLAYELSQHTKGTFNAWIVPRRSEVHVGRKGHYDRDARDRAAALFVAADKEGVSYGFRVGKPDGEPETNWPWPALMAALAGDKQVRQALRSAMETHGLSLDVHAMRMSYGSVGEITVQDTGFLWRHETAEQEMIQAMSWEELVDYLQTVAPDKRCDLLLYKRLPVAEALEAGAGASNEIVAVLEALLPLYDVSIGV